MKLIASVLFFVHSTLKVDASSSGIPVVVSKPEEVAEANQTWWEWFLYGAVHHNDFDSIYREIFSTRNKPAFWQAYISHFVMPLGFLLLFGPPTIIHDNREKAEETATWSKGNMALVLGLSIVGLKEFFMDAKNVAHVLVAPGLGIRQKIGGVIFAFSFSSNVLTYCSLASLVLLYSTVEHDMHANMLKPMPEKVRKDLLAAKGRFWVRYLDAYFFTYRWPSLGSFFLAIAAGLLYIFILLPVGVTTLLLCKLVMVPVARWIVVKRRAYFEKTQQPLIDTNGVCYIPPMFGDDEEDYKRDTGVYKLGWFKYFFPPVYLSLLAPLMLPIFGRLIAGDGYWGSVVATFVDWR